jgi:hypothetical protein
MIKKIKFLFYTLFFIFPGTVLAQYPIVQGASSVSDNSIVLPILNTVRQVMTWVLGGIGMLAILSLLLSLMLYLISAGDEERIGDSAKAFKTAVVQIFIAVFGLTIVYFAGKVFDDQRYF